LSSAEASEVNSRRVVRLQRVGALLVVILVSLAAVLARDRLVEYERYGYLGVFVTTLVGSATVVLPVPALAIVYVGGSLWNPLLVGLIAGLG
jgi:putative effector of murein hydrolase